MPKIGLNEIAILIIIICPFLYCLFADITIKCEKQLNRKERRKKQ